MDMAKEFIRERVIPVVICESALEYSLPDYNTDVKKILLTGARAVPSGSYQNGDSIELVGSVYYDMVYVDGENEITHLDFTSDYSIAFKINGEEYKDSNVTARVTNYLLRLAGPRKIIAKATVSCEAHVTESDRIEIIGDAFSEGEPETVSKTVRLRTASYVSGGEREYAEPVFRLDGAIADETDLLFSSVEPENMTATQAADGINIKGTMLVSALIKSQGAEPILMKKRLPYSETIEDGGAVCNENTDVRVVVTSQKITLNADEDGVEAVASFIVDPSLRIVENTAVNAIEDCYLKDRGCDNEYRDMPYTELVDSHRHEDRFTGQMTRDSAGCGEVRNLICPIVQVRNEAVRREGDDLKAECELRFLAIGCEVNDSGEVTYSSVKIDIPYSERIDVNFGCCDGLRYECYAEATDATITVDGDNVYPECNIRFYISAVRDRNEKILAASSLNEDRYEKTAAKVTVYFPEESDTLFSVAKKFHTSLLAVASDNSLSEDCISSPAGRSSLAGVKKLIIK